MAKKVEWPEPPDHLSERSQLLWSHLVGDRVKSPERIALFQTALDALDRADEAKQVLDAEGLTFTTKTTGTKHLHPLLRVEKDARALFARIWNQLSLHWNQQIDGAMTDPW